jgi:hypothetical protein
MVTIQKIFRMFQLSKKSETKLNQKILEPAIKD